MCKHKLEQIPFLHLPRPQSKRTFIFKACYPPKKEATDLFFSAYGHANASLNKFPFARAKTPIQTNFYLHSCCPQTKKQHCSICSACGQNLRSVAVCLAWCANVECAPTPSEAELQRSADENTRGQKHRALHSARTVPTYSAPTVHAQCTLQCTATKTL